MKIDNRKISIKEAKSKIYAKLPTAEFVDSVKCQTKDIHAVKEVELNYKVEKIADINGEGLRLSDLFKKLYELVSQDEYS